MSLKVTVHPPSHTDVVGWFDPFRMRIKAVVAVGVGVGGGLFLLPSQPSYVEVFVVRVVVGLELRGHLPGGQRHGLVHHSSVQWLIHSVLIQEVVMAMILSSLVDGCVEGFVDTWVKYG